MVSSVRCVKPTGITGGVCVIAVSIYVIQNIKQSDRSEYETFSFQLSQINLTVIPKPTGDKIDYNRLVRRRELYGLEKRFR